MEPPSIFTSKTFSIHRTEPTQGSEKTQGKGSTDLMVNDAVVEAVQLWLESMPPAVELEWVQI